MKVLIVVVAALLLVAVGQAAPGEAGLVGTVLDPSGLGIPGVTLTLVDSVTGASRTAVTDKYGVYRLPDLPMGTYHLNASYPGFAPYSQDVTLDANGSRKYDVTLQLSATKESVTVETQASDAYVPLGGAQSRVENSDQARDRNTAELLADLPASVCGRTASLPLSHCCMEWGTSAPNWWSTA